MKRALPFLAVLAACHGGGSGGSGESGLPFDPPAAAWVGGCFWNPSFAAVGPVKLADGYPGPEVVAWGCSCGNCAVARYPIGSANGGGLVYLDNYDPSTFAGDVTVLTDGPGSVPRVVAPRGGAGISLPGSPVARFSPLATGMLVLRGLSGAAGTLVLVDLPDAAAPRDVGSQARIANYEWLSESAFLYVGNYRARTPVTASLGDLLYQERGGTPQLVASDARRFDFVMYRLSADKARVAWISSPGELWTRTLPPGAAAELVAPDVASARFADDGTLVYAQQNPDGTTFTLGARLPGGARVTVDPRIASAAVAGDRLVWLRDLSLAGGFGTLLRLRLADLAGPFAPEVLSASAAPAFLGTARALAWVDVTAGSASGALRLGAPGDASFAAPDPAATPAGGLALSPAGGLLAYATGWEEHPSPSSPNPMPGVAAELRIAPVAGGPPLTVATAAHARAAFSTNDAWVAALRAFEPARSRGELVFRSTSSSGPVVGTAPGVGADHFAFGDGEALALLRDWDDGLQVGVLAVATPAGGFTAVDSGVSFFTAPRAGRVLYGIRTGPRAGLWVGGK